MAARPSDSAESPLSLVERKQRAARARIVEAADALFDERGFDAVSVTDIAERAEVGRTTFFRLFGDKTEVVFAREQAVHEAVRSATTGSWAAGRPIDTLGGALRALEPIVLEACRQATADRAAFRRHTRLLEAHEELGARDALKNQAIASELASALVAQGAARETATLAAQLAVACYTGGRLLAGARGDIVAQTRAAFRQALQMGPIDADA
ncbi:TetR/AcrR family transcriptional regulator [Cnuibacter sp. UC19_7]|uniref:TetR/AcrR family transcriptional regulator n=1 Tax=Cnuibacter sp. UC19_7 TaxID=3350166 RepID=UPI00366B4F77